MCWKKIYKSEHWGYILWICIIFCFIPDNCFAKNDYDKGMEYYEQGQYTEAVKYFKKGADFRNQPDEIFYADRILLSSYYLGICYCYGRGVKQDHKEARKRFMKAAYSEGTSPIKKYKEESMCRIGLYYVWGVGVKKDYKQAAKWFSMAAKENSSYGPALYRTGWCYYYGRGVKKDYNQAAKRLQESLDYPYVNYTKRENFPDEDFIYEAHFLLGECFYHGRGVGKNYSKAVEHYKNSSSLLSGIHYDAYCALGRCYEKGHGVEKNEEEALRYFDKAAKAENATAQCWFGDQYRRGIITSKNEVEAVKWYRKAAKQNNIHGLKWLAWHYRYGRGVKKDPVKAKELEEKTKQLLKEQGEDQRFDAVQL